MLRSSMLRTLASAIVALAIFNYAATRFFWYGLVWWLDIPAHFLGGVCVMYLSALVLLPLYRRGVGLTRYLYGAAGLALVLGLGWEALEYYLYSYSGVVRFIPIDALSDVCFDLAGIWFAGRRILSLTARSATSS